jgi:DNA adenine methylase
MFNLFNSKPRKYSRSITKYPKVCQLDGKTKCASDMSLKPPIARPGGKRQLADKIIKEMKPHTTYSEPFFGGGAVFYKKPLASKSYLNDKDRDVITVHKSFKNSNGFNRCDNRPSKAKFERIKNKKNKSACDIAYLNKLSFGSGMTSYALGKFMDKNPTGTYTKRFPMKKKDLGISYQQAHDKDYKNKLSKATITSQDFRAVMKKADSKKTVHFLDPPYVKGSEIYKEKGVTPKEVCDTAKQMKGQVIITYDNHPEVRKACKGFKTKRISSRYTLGADSNSKKSKELMLIKP